MATSARPSTPTVTRTRLPRPRRRPQPLLRCLTRWAIRSRARRRLARPQPSRGRLAGAGGRVPLLLLGYRYAPQRGPKIGPITHILYVLDARCRLQECAGCPAVCAPASAGHQAPAVAPQRGGTRRSCGEAVRELVAPACHPRGPRPRPLWRRVHHSTRRVGGNERLRRGLVRASRALTEPDGWTSSASSRIGRGVDGDHGRSGHDRTSRSPDLPGANASAISMPRPPTPPGDSGHPSCGLTNGCPPADMAGWTGARAVRELGADLIPDDDRPRRFWERLGRISDERLWDAHQQQKLELAYFARGRLRNQFRAPRESRASWQGQRGARPAI